MKNKILSIVLTVICLLAFATNVCANDYRGTLSNITMNGKVFGNVTGQSFSLTDKKDGTYHLTGKVQQIGKMPGTISIDFSVKITDGIITPINIYKPVGNLIILKRVPIAIKLRNITGSFTNNTLHFVLETYAGWEKIPTFPASVTFDGTLQL